MKIYNSLSKQLEDFKPIESGLVKMYCCGPTVYMHPHIGNWRLFSLSDFVYRALRFNGYKVDFVMNMTDVGHLFEEQGNPEGGEDKIEKQAVEEGKSAKEIVDFYIKEFLKGYKDLNLSEPRKFTRATEYVDDQIDLIATLEEKGYTYETSDGVYFDTSKFSSYGELSGLTVENIKEGARIDPNPEKKNPTDFALWKFSPTSKKRQQEWQSPWGIGFPGWHLECSAMVLSELGDTIDIHLGGEDLKMIHHQNEIAQSECATGKKFVNYWIHSAFLMVDAGKMSKSLGNFYTLSEVVNKGFNPLDLRYLYMTAHYRTPLNFTWEALSSAQNSLNKIYEIVGSYEQDPKAEISDKYIKKFREKLEDDFNTPEALAVVWELLKSAIPEDSKLNTILKMDEFLGLKLQEHIGYEIPNNIIDLAKMRREYRRNGIWDKADVIRKQILGMGYIVEDTPSGEFKVKKKF
ncbi:cysteine--tRNA ligase [candidate division WWE3 bacterium]|uniref:Cysteine--tRNA ligase n=1 Tax=candidate division WWE3 bacterium TaxID=2053526 RepID=A0A7X9E7H2_UNCKA|nr:cysteine--tRNA ligase [candidate division WWE3 bacterium]